MIRSQRIRRILTAGVCAAALALGGMAAGTTAASATTSPGSGPAVAPATTYFQIQSLAGAANWGCIQETGTSSGVFLGTCSTNHSDYWYAPPGDPYELANEHSNLCLSVTGTDAGVYLNACSPGATAQEWAVNSTCAGYGPAIYNLHSHYYLWQSNNSVQQRSACSSSTHDAWAIG